MGPTSKDAVVKTLGHLIDELLQQREVGKETLNEVRKLVKRLADQESDHEQLAAVVAKLPRKANGNGQPR